MMISLKMFGGITGRMGIPIRLPRPGVALGRAGSAQISVSAMLSQKSEKSVNFKQVILPRYYSSLIIEKHGRLRNA